MQYYIKNFMRFISAFTAPAVSLVLAGCVSVAAQQQLLDSTPVTQAGTDNGSCSVEHIVHNAPHGVGAGRPGLDPDSISVLNWNIYKGLREDWATDFRRYIHKHDIVTIQEARLGDDLLRMLDREHRYWALNSAFQYRDRGTGVLTAASVRPLYSCGQRTTEPLIQLPKTSLVSVYPIEGLDENLLVANIHGINFTPGVDAYREQIEELYFVMKDHGGPVVLAGDFNTWSEERMQIVDDLARLLALESLDYTNHNRTTLFGRALDHVFYRGLEPVEHATWQVTSSDHNPTRVRFRVSGRPPAPGRLAAMVLHEDS